MATTSISPPTYFAQRYTTNAVVTPPNTIWKSVSAWDPSPIDGVIMIKFVGSQKCIITVAQVFYHLLGLELSSIFGLENVHIYLYS